MSYGGYNYIHSAKTLVRVHVATYRTRVGAVTSILPSARVPLPQGKGNQKMYPAVELDCALERVLERKGFIARHSGLRLCWPSLAIIGLLGLPFSVVFFAQFGLAFLLVSIFTSISHVMASDFRPSFLDFLGGGAFISAFITFRSVLVSK